MRLHSIKPYFIAFFLAVAASGCLKDSLYDNGTFQATAGGTTQVIGLGIQATNVNGFLLYNVDASDNDTSIALVPVTLGGPTDATQDIHVTVVQDSTVVMAYDTAQAQLGNTSDYISPLPANFTILNGGVVTIPKGARTGFLSVKFTPNNFLGADYAVGFTIQSVKESGYVISGNLKSGVIAIGVKNKYDGSYSLTQKTVGWAAYGIADGLTFTWPDDVSLITAGPNSLSIFDDKGFANLQVAFTPTGAATGFGATTPLYTFDPVTNLLTSVVNTTPDDGRARTLSLNPAVTDSRYDPATQTIYAAYIMTQSGRPNQEIYDTLVYQGPR